MGKKGDLAAYGRANAFVLEPEVLPKLFGPLARRYKERVGGYTRIHKFGNRPGDNAPNAILELVDNPHDIKFEMTARAVGWEILSKRLGQGGPQNLMQTGVDGIKDVLKRERRLAPKDTGELREKTRWNLQKVLKFSGGGALVNLQRKAEDHIVRSIYTIRNTLVISVQDSLLARPLVMKQLLAAQADKKDDERLAVSPSSFNLKAGQTLPGGTKPTLRIAAGALGKEPRVRLAVARRKLGINRDFSALWNTV